jgi:hypothetical protein
LQDYKNLANADPSGAWVAANPHLMKALSDIMAPTRNAPEVAMPPQ